MGTESRTRRFRLASPTTALAAGGLVLALLIAYVPLASLAHQSLNAGGSMPLLPVVLGAAGFVLASRKPRNHSAGSSWPRPPSAR